MDIDGRRVIDNGGVHGAAPAAAVVALDRGVHAVHLEYVQNGGRMAMEWLSARDDAPLVPLSPWTLTPGRTAFGAFVASAVLHSRRDVRRIRARSLALAYSFAYAVSVDILMIEDSRYTLERFFSARAGSADRIGFVFPSLYNPRVGAWSNGEMTSIEQLQWENPRWFVLNEDYARLEPADTPIGQLVRSLEAGTLDYVPGYHARTPAPFAWLPSPHRDLTGPRQEPPNQVTSSLRHINPQFVVFERR